MNTDTATSRIAELLIESAEHDARQRVAELPAAYLRMIGMDTPEAVEAYVAAAVTEAGK